MKEQVPWALAILLVISALGLINSQYHARKLFAQVELAQVQTRQLEIEWGQLQIKQSANSQHALVEDKANGLDMVRIDKTNTEFIRQE